MADVIIYTRDFCSYSSRALSLLRHKKANFEEINVKMSQALRKEMQEKSGRNTFPQIFIGEQHIGGCDDLYALEAAGKLEGMLAE